MKLQPDNKKVPILLITILVLLCLASLASLLIPSKKQTSYIADIFQNGILIMSIPLNEETETRTLTITGENGCTNEIEIRPGSIGIRSADCPDKLCVKQGFISDTRLPITCLPNRLVIQLRAADHTAEESVLPDTITY